MTYHILYIHRIGRFKLFIDRDSQIAIGVTVSRWMIKVELLQFGLGVVW